ncbi:hypothetical protein ACFFJY_02495 [Fictibacillus aquaticus]|uniref:Lipoprotein n=1 Tax=Fictibacillus aquaticus TaxID=2021314 RepID=A0A235F910_9BACL|nr:hypothetical protein [Fictibacillus aquaticus]OYD57574.1 hypothetical protein CGZ90_12965 [Fictibacillus aquaticus]
MNWRKYIMMFMSAIMLSGLLVGCNEKRDNQEPDPTEEPSEEKKENKKKDEGEPDPTDEPSEEKKEEENENKQQ